MYYNEDLQYDLRNYKDAVEEIRKLHRFESSNIVLEQPVPSSSCPTGLSLVVIGKTRGNAFDSVRYDNMVDDVTQHAATNQWFLVVQPFNSNDRFCIPEDAPVMVSRAALLQKIDRILQEREL